MNSMNESLLSLTWEDLRQWAGSTIMGRGKTYIKNVSDLARTESGGLIAWVAGTEDYATNVEADEDGELDWFCSCPYDWGPCKHAVAVVLAALEQEKAGRKLPLVDKRGDLYLAVFDETDDDDEFLDEDDPDDQEVTVGSSGSDGGKNPAVAGILGEKSKEELIVLLTDLAARHPEVKRKILEDDQLRSGRIDKLAIALRKEIKAVTGEPAWNNHWNDEGNSPDYSHIKEQFAALLKEGHADIVVELGCDLWQRGNEQVEQSHDDGDVAYEIGDCMEIVFQAVEVSSLSRPEQLLWMIDIFLEDQYSISDSCEQFIRNKIYGRTDWAEVAVSLQERLNTMPAHMPDNFSSGYHRERVMNWLIEALERSGQRKKVIPLLEREADLTQCYERLVDTYLQSSNYDKAREWCVKGFQKTVENAPGIAASLQKKLRELAWQENKFDLVAAYRAQDFFNNPTPANYLELEKAAEAIGCWPTVRAEALSFLESGQRPDMTDAGSSGQPWPLPSPEVAVRSDKRFRRDFPDLGNLIEIAILEKRFDDVVQLYQTQQKTIRWGIGKGREVAAAVAGTHPDISLAIWKKLAEGQIDLVKPKAYEVAAGYLRKMHNIYQKTGRLEQWRTLLQILRTTHKAKRRLMEVLDLLENKRIID
ncbi:MAG: SWIM zinc finger family protein [Proteobacteria bacterium]|nr:SWIM zinc finger family protein [Pseudomonadota bacterium]MBU4029370.1 SWIM zinc finger family protein [Pseudomonadota bacterium]MBU4326149.1 SWIM zinc finger family protein [Pseudomonadota bacterium]MBU4586438.1 SWIM zinc finger family protein [Pseudomonadota bacterium]MCG2742837.1 SWIM zinc finger family protein [Desulfobacteraceae bacterium]